ncbi:MAG: hypothetical protein JO326_12830, partial [Acetobacteraceae bacterium]|nr:hypothetical protein [Acetobacteraceae bacterium]
GVIVHNITTGQATKPKHFTPPAMTLHDGTPVVPRIAGYTAEWVLERQTDPTTKQLAPFPDFTPTRFTHCRAGVAPDYQPPTQARSLRVHRWLRLYDRGATSEATTYVAMPVPDDQHPDHAFTVYNDDRHFHAA